MTLSVAEAERLVREGAAALQQSRPADARRLLETITATGRANVQIWLMLASACQALDDPVGEEQALDALLAIDSKIVRALILKGDCRARADDLSAAIRFYKLAVEAAAGQNLPSGLASEVGRADTMAAQYGARLLARMDEMLAGNGLPPGMRSARFRESLEIRAGTRQIYLQEPTGYFFPGLPHLQYFERETLGWTGLVEAHTEIIRAELEAVMTAGMEDFRPYMNSGVHGQQNVNATLIDSYDWSTLFLIENGQRFDDLIARCPRTWEAVHAAPLCSIPGNGPTVMFSLLKPGARIAPHTGMFNTRLTCHLPLIVPPGCGFRVGNEVREWEVGKLLIFDDTIEHEAWNEGLSDRVVLIFDIWRPELSEQERREVAALLTVA